MDNFSFYSLIKDYKICIPLIQRDYAQGRDFFREKRDKFLDVIFNSILNNQELTLDFIYGKIQERRFYPVDGQQRLTTLFLIHYWLSPETDGKVNEEARKVLENFCYELRTDTETFCNYLLKEKKTLKFNDVSWFRQVWKKDLTICSMIEMLEAVEDKLKFYKKNTLKDKKEMWDKLISSNIINFNFFDMAKKDFKQTDVLYIKMNDRGKQLTNFENFKANFIEFLNRNFNDKKKEFEEKIETDWLDLFWKYRDKEEVPDKMFMQYFDCIAQICFFKNSLDAKAENYNFEKNWEEIFKVKDNITILFDFLNFFVLLSKNNDGKIDEESPCKIENFFFSVFSDETCKLFWNKEGDNDQRNFFKTILLRQHEFEVRNKILFYYLIKYCVSKSIYSVNDSLIKYIRLIRNILCDRRSFRSKGVSYRPDVNINDFNVISKDLDLITDRYSDNIKKTFNSESAKKQQEIMKLIEENKISYEDVVSTENCSCLESNLSNFDLRNNYKNFNSFTNGIKEIFESDIQESLIIRALIVSGFKGRDIKWTRLGKAKFYGKKNKFTAILTDENDKTKCLIKLLESYKNVATGTTEEKLKKIIQNKEKEYNNKDWQYYFIKYDSFLSKDNSNYYAGDNIFEYEMLKSYSESPTIAYHISPFVLEVCNQLKNAVKCKKAECCYAIYSDRSYIDSNMGNFYCTKDGWKNSKDKSFHLEMNDNQDMIEVMVSYLGKQSFSW